MAVSSGYVSDTFTKDRLTLNLGLRFDHQTGTDTPSTTEANSFIPNLLPTLDYAGGAGNVSWNDFSPRLGLTYALDDARHTDPARLLRALRGPDLLRRLQLAEPAGPVLPRIRLERRQP